MYQTVYNLVVYNGVWCVHYALTYNTWHANSCLKDMVKWKVKELLDSHSDVDNRQNIACIENVCFHLERFLDDKIKEWKSLDHYAVTNVNNFESGLDSVKKLYKISLLL